MTGPSPTPPTDPPGASETLYFVHEDGRVATRQILAVTGSDGLQVEVHPPEGFTSVSAQEGQQRAAQHAAERDETIRRGREQQRLQRKTDYEALVSLGLPEQTARRLSGHVPDQPG